MVLLPTKSSNNQSANILLLITISSQPISYYTYYITENQIARNRSIITSQRSWLDDVSSILY